MDDLSRRILSAGQGLDPRWDEDQVDLILSRAKSRLRRRRIARAGVGVGAPLLLLAGMIAAGASGVFDPVTVPEAAVIATTHGDQTQAGALHFADGSVASPLSDDSTLVADEVSPSSVAVRLERGAARFEVTPRPERLFQVRAGPVSVLVLGTIFSVRHQAQGVAVEVERGRVRVAWEGGVQLLEAGESGIFPPEPADESPDLVEEPTTEPLASAPRPHLRTETPPRPAPDLTWQELAEQGQFDEAWTALQSSGRTPQSMEELLLAADVARLTGHPGDASRWLRQAVDGHSGDPRASVAAFTLGRVLLNQSGQPREAAEAFARARRLSPGGALAEDALAREVEAWFRAGAPEAARQRAEQYLERYPRGRRAGAVRRFGGME